MTSVELDAMRGSRVVITGGAGFVGSSIARRIGANNDVVLLDRAFGSAVDDLTLVTRVEADIRDPEAVRKCLDGADVVIHAAAVVGVQRVVGDARGTLETNLLGTANVLDAVEGKDLTRFVLFSTSEVFGRSAFRVDEKALATVGTAIDPRWSYSVSKLAGEHLGYAHHRDFELPLVVVRPFNVFGPGRTGDHAMLRFIRMALEGKPLEVHGDGAQIRSWCYIDDFVDAVLAMLVTPAAVGEDFNIGNSRNTMSIYELAKLTVRLAGSQSSIEFHDIDFSDVDIRVPDHSKAEHLLGYRPQIEVEEGINRTIEWCSRFNW